MYFRIVGSLALLYMLRMLGLFMILPVLTLYGDAYSGASLATLGLALGIYGLSQAVLQIPFGLLSDVLGRKPVIFIGLVIFIAGSVVAALADTITGLLIGRILQGAGAIAGAVMAMVADLTPDNKRSQAMAFIGASIGVSFGLALILGPWLAAGWGIQGVFSATAISAGFGLVVLLFLVPNVPKAPERPTVDFWATLKSEQLLRLNLGIFTLHAVLMCAFVVVPGLLENFFGIAREQHWWVYLALLGGSFFCMAPLLSQMEKRNWVKVVFLFAIVLLALSLASLSLILQLHWQVLAWLLLFLFFFAFNLLEATLPSLVSKLAPEGTKGTALGVYSSSQFLGAFCGGVIGGYASQYWGAAAALILCAGLALVWLAVAAGLRIQARPLPQTTEMLP